jgi:hypothetical protein
MEVMMKRNPGSKLYTRRKPKQLGLSSTVTTHGHLMRRAEDASRPRRAFRIVTFDGMTIRLARYEPPTKPLFRG